MGATIERIKREFHIIKSGKTTNLPDPNPSLTIDQVKKFYLDQYPELVTSSFGPPKIVDDIAVYSTTHVLGCKG